MTYSSHSDPLQFSSMTTLGPAVMTPKFWTYIVSWYCPTRRANIVQRTTIHLLAVSIRLDVSLLGNIIFQTNAHFSVSRKVASFNWKLPWLEVLDPSSETSVKPSNAEGYPHQHQIKRHHPFCWHMSLKQDPTVWQRTNRTLGTETEC